MIAKGETATHHNFDMIFLMLCGVVQARALLDVFVRQRAKILQNPDFVLAQNPFAAYSCYYQERRPFQRSGIETIPPKRSA
jgi:hypothetical protein